MLLSINTKIFINMLMMNQWIADCWAPSAPAAVSSSAHISRNNNNNNNNIHKYQRSVRSRRSRMRTTSFLASSIALLLVTLMCLANSVSQVRGSSSAGHDLDVNVHPNQQDSHSNGSPINHAGFDNDSVEDRTDDPVNSSTGERGSRSRRHCPSCQLAMANHQDQQRSQHTQQPIEQQQRHRSSESTTGQSTVGDTARLESIKRQILVKLGLNAKPNLLSTIPPRDFILETLLRAEESTIAAAPVAHSSDTTGKHHHHHSASADSSQENSVEDDFYGKTSEIIAFGEPGPRLNGQVLAEFSRVQETAPEPSLRVKSATLWLYVQLRYGDGYNGYTSQPKSRHHRHFQPDRTHSHHNNKRPPTLYVFRLLSHQQPYTTNISLDKNWNELLASQKVTIQHSGWMKINITEGVQKWFSAPSSSTSLSSSKLQLLVDCSGCGTNVEPVLFSSSPASQNNKKKKKKRRRRRRRRRLVEDLEDDNNQETEEDQRQQDDPDRRQRQQHRPFIVIHTDSNSGRRLRRRTPLDCSPTTSACCKQRFFVSFRALGWDDWIIAPSGYYANYCRGDCGGGPSGPSRTPDTFLSYHSHVIDEVRKLPSFQPPLASPSLPFGSSSLPKIQDEEYRHQLMKQQQQQQLYASLQPCCAPTKFSSMSLIYFGPDMNIIKRDLPKMVVDECGCP